jgi:hypothetical protein
VADPIREFLVSLGFKVDNAGMRAFQGAISGATKVVQGLGSTIKGVAEGAADSMKKLALTFGLSTAGITLAIKRMADDFSELYYAVQRTGSSAENLMALRYASAQVGLGFKGMEAQVESFAQRMRTVLGTEQWVNSLGIATRRTNGQLRDTSRIFIDIAKWYDRMARQGPAGEALAISIVEQLGIDPVTLRQSAKNLEEINRALEEYREKQRAAGIDPTRLTQLWVDFERTMRSIFATLGVGWDRIAQELLPLVLSKLKELNTWLTDHQKEFTDYIVAGVREFVALLENKQTWDNIKSTLTEVKDAFVAVSTVISQIVDGIKWLSEHQIPIPGFMGGPQTPQEGRPFIDPNGPSAPRQLLNRLRDWWTGGGNADIARMRAPFREELEQNPALKRRLAALVDLENPQAGTGVVESLMNRMLLAREAGRAGTIAEGIGGGAGSFYGPVRRGQVEGRLAELERNPERLAARMRNIDEALAGSNIIRGYTDQGSPGDPNYVAGGVGVNIAGERFNDYGGFGGVAFARRWREAMFGAPALASTGGGGSSGVGITQTNNINVTGHDAPEAARAIQNTMDRVNGDMVRNLRGAVDPVGPRQPEAAAAQ